MKKTLLVLLAIAFSFTFPTISSAQQTALVVGWNIKGVDPIPSQRITRISAVIRQLNPDLIVLSEVNPNSVPADIVQQLGPSYQAAVILPQNPTVVQNIALIFKTGVSVTNARLIDGTDLTEEPRSRKALAANVRIGNFDFIVIGVHLKSSREEEPRNQRTRQCRALAQFISQATAGSEKDVLVVGDYNMIPRMGSTANDEVNFIAMSPTNFLRFVSSDFLLGQISHIGRCTPSFRGNLLDGFAISRTFTSEYIPGTTRLISFADLGTNCSDFNSNVSDHRPIVSRFRIVSDDD